MNSKAAPYRDEAAAVFDNHLGQEQIESRDRSERDIREGLYIEDVRAEVLDYWADIEVLEEIGASVPMIRVSESMQHEAADFELAPASEFEEGVEWDRDARVQPAFVPFELPTSTPHGFPRFPRSRPYYRYRRDEVYDFMVSLDRIPSESMKLSPIEESKKSFRLGVVDFLAMRIASVVDFFTGLYAINSNAVQLNLPRSRQTSATTYVKTVGFSVDVHTNTPNLRIHSSLSFRRRWRYFGAPTSPATSVLPGGIYEFGADGGLYGSITADQGTFDIPYGTLPPRLNL
jgi:hypothetical protein